MPTSKSPHEAAGQVARSLTHHGGQMTRRLRGTITAIAASATLARVAADRVLTLLAAMLTSSSRVRRTRSHKPTWTSRPGSVTIPVVRPSKVSRSMATTGPGYRRGRLQVPVKGGQPDGHLGLQPAAVLAAGGHDGQHGQQAGAPSRVAGARRAGHQVDTPLLVAHRDPGQPVRDRATARLPGGQEH
jgi:hypothetical protein